jgi:hypothetical protein
MTEERRQDYSVLNNKLNKVLECQAKNQASNETHLEYIKEGMGETRQDVARIRDENTKQWIVINENKTGLAVLKKTVAIFSSIISSVLVGAVAFLKHIWPK